MSIKFEFDGDLEELKAFVAKIENVIEHSEDNAEVEIEEVDEDESETEEAFDGLHDRIHRDFVHIHKQLKGLRDVVSDNLDAQNWFSNAHELLTLAEASVHTGVDYATEIEA